MLKLQLVSPSSRRTSTLFSLSTLFSFLLLAVLCCSSWLVQVQAFVSPLCWSSQHHAFDFSVAAKSETGDNDPNEIVARRILVEGDVAGGYYRSCVRNEAGRFRRLCGTMTPPDDSRQAEIYVEGKRKMVEGFCRWVKKSDVGLSQTITVSEVLEEDPTGLYDEFYVKIR